MTVGVAVEGPSDRIFWDKVLHKHFPKIRFDVRCLQNRERLLRSANSLMEMFRSLHYQSGFLLVDRDKSPCVSAVRDELEATVKSQLTVTKSKRDFWLFVAVRGLEAWYLADGNAIREALPKSDFTPPKETATINPKTTLKKLWRAEFGECALNKKDLATRMAPKFKPVAACEHSQSFDYFWKHLCEFIATV